jgi:hypothetical protein
MKTYTLEKKPNFVNGQWVMVDFAHLGMKEDAPNRYIRGQVKGKAIEHIIDYWIVDFEDGLRGITEFQCLSVPHVAIVDNGVVGE